MIAVNKKNEYSAFLKEKLIDKGLQFIESKENNIVLNKKYSELEEINILIDNKTNDSYVFHLTLPLKNSIFSFYKKIYDEETFSTYLEQYIDYISL